MAPQAAMQTIVICVDCFDSGCHVRRRVSKQIMIINEMNGGSCGGIGREAYDLFEHFCYVLVCLVTETRVDNVVGMILV